MGAGLPPNLPTAPPIGGAQTPPPSVPGLTNPSAPPTPPPALMQLLARRPEQSNQLMKQAIALLNQIADMDPRQEPRIGAAIKLLQGPSKPGSEP